MESAVEIFGWIAGGASIIGLITSIKNESVKNIILYLIVLISIGVGGYFFYSYKKVTDEKLRMEERREAMRNEAKQIIDTAPYYISKYRPGENEGIVLNTLVLLEKNKDLFPDTYEIFKEDVVQKIHSSNQSTSSFQESEDLENAANASLQILRKLSE